jgi:hypothetical protein
VKCKITEVFKVELKPFDTVPIQLIAELRARLSNIRTMLRSVPAGSRVWRTLAAGPMLLDIEGWRFQYRVDVNHRRLIVEEALYLGK